MRNYLYTIGICVLSVVDVLSYTLGWVSMNIVSINIASMRIDFRQKNANEYNIY